MIICLHRVHVRDMLAQAQEHVCDAFACSAPATSRC